MKNNKRDYKFITGFRKITLKDIAEKLSISRTSIITGATSDDNLSKVRLELQKQIARLFLEDE